MSCMCRMRDRAKNKWGRIHLVDKCLLIILFILMLQSALSLFAVEGNTPERNSIDVVIRTSAAGIFGYLVSANFDQQRKRSAQSRTVARGAPVVQTETGQSEVQAKIGFATGDSEGRLESAESPKLGHPATQEHKNCDRAQIMIVAAVGLISLCVLLFYRNLSPENPAATGSLTQFRDFVSGSVGFLISCSTSEMGERTGTT